MIKKLLIYSMTLFSVGLSYGQSIEADKRLEAKYSKAELQDLAENNQNELAFLNYCIEGAYTLMPVPGEKDISSEVEGSIKIEDITNINFFDLGMELDETTWKYYHIEGTEKLFVVYSKAFILKQIKNNK